MADEKKDGVDEIKEEIEAAVEAHGASASADSEYINEYDDTFFERFSSMWQSTEKDDFTTFEPVSEMPLEEAEEPDSHEILWPKLIEFQLDDLYSEVLYTVLHMIGCDVVDGQDQQSLISYLQEVFNVDPEKHAILFQGVQCKEAPQLVLNLEVTEAKNLKGKDVNDSSDPFCTMFMASNTLHKNNTTMKPNTLNPVWKEYFSFPVTSIQEDTLNIEVLDYDPEETAVEKMKRIGEVKSTRGLKKLVKEIALLASTKKQTHDFLGMATVPMKSIPATGLEKWFTLQGRPNSKACKRGEIKLRLHLGSEKNKDVAMQEYKQLLQLLLIHELDCSKVEPYHWNGQLPLSARKILSQHASQGSLSDTDICLAQWMVFAQVHYDHPLNLKLFPLLLEKLKRAIERGSLSEEEERRFWIAAEKLIDKTVIFVKRLHYQSPQNTSIICTQLYNAARIMAILISYLPPKVEAPSANGGTVTWKVRPTECDIREKIEVAAKTGADEFLYSIFEKNPLPSEVGKQKLDQLVTIMKLVLADLYRTKESYHNIFKELLDVNYFSITSLVYDSQITPLVKPVVLEVCEKLKPLSFNENNLADNLSGNVHLNMGTTLFGLYQNLQQFVKLGIDCFDKETLLGMQDFFEWFKRGVSMWLEIAIFQAMRRIFKAVQLDKLVPIDKYVHHSSSAVDTTTVFYQIKTFWTELSWPDAEGRYTFATKILDDICRCSVYYSEMMCKRVEGVHGEDHYGKYEVTNELCLVINNMDFVQAAIKPLADTLELEGIIEILMERDGQDAADQCRRTLEVVVNNALENMENQILQVLDTIGRKMAPGIYRFLLEGADLVSSDSYTTVDKMMKYLGSNLEKLESGLNKKNFDRVFTIIWENASQAIFELIENNIDKRRSPTFFKNIHQALEKLAIYFDADPSDETLVKLKAQLKIYGMETWDLIHAYHQERLQEQEAMESAENGMVGVRARVCEDHLQVEIMNARKIKPMDSNGLCDPYIKVHLVPEDRYPNCPKLKTKVQKKTLFPLFDEIFSIPLTTEEQNVRGAMIIFTLKDHDVIGYNRFMAEAFLPLGTVPRTNPLKLLRDMDQVHLHLSRPSNHDSEVLKALESRKWDRMAHDFVKKQKQNMQ